MREFIIQRQDSGQRFDKYLKRILPMASTGFLYKMLRKKNITLNGGKAEGKELLKINDCVNLYFSEETFLKFSSFGEKNKKDISYYLKAYHVLSDISVVFQNEDILILNKPAGILSQKANNSDISLNEWAIGYLLHKNLMTAEQLKVFKPSVCNRLDRNTSGLVMCGISLPGSRMLGHLLKGRELHKYYLTFVCGILRKEVHAKGYLVKDSRTNKVIIYAKKEEIPPSQVEVAEWIETVIKPLAVDQVHKVTKLEVLLITGKSHQIRAHLSSLGYPIVGDQKYGYLSNSIDVKVKAQLLHAYKVIFPEQLKECGELSNKEYFAPLPESFTRMEESLCLHGVHED